MPLLERNGAKIHYETWGQGGDRWMTLVNGHTRTLSDFRLFARFLLERGWRVLSFDNRGAGKTVCRPDFRLGEIVEDLLALWKQNGIVQSHLLGISFGGAIALSVARDHAERLSSLSLVSTAPRFEHVRRTGEERPEMSRYVSPRFVKMNPLLFRALTKETGKAYADPARAAGTQAQQRALEGFEAGPWLDDLAVPTLVVHGEDDAVIPPHEARELASTIPGAKLVLLPGAGHLLLAEAPRKLYQAVAEFAEGGMH